MPKRTADARWEGSLQEGRGTMRLGTGAYEGAYSFQSRFEEGEGTNPEELIGAALAGCFSMALSADLARAGHEPQSVETTASVFLRSSGEEGPRIDRIDLDTRGRVPGVSEDEFAQFADATKSCIVSRALAGVNEIRVESTLES